MPGRSQPDLARRAGRAPGRAGAGTPASADIFWDVGRGACRRLARPAARSRRRRPRPPFLGSAGRGEDETTPWAGRCGGGGVVLPSIEPVPAAHQSILD